jgi:hypothetical protein
MNKCIVCNDMFVFKTKAIPSFQFSNYSSVNFSVFVSGNVLCMAWYWVLIIFSYPVKLFTLLYVILYDYLHWNLIGISVSLITNILAPVWNLVLISSFWNYRMRDRYYFFKMHLWKDILFCVIIAFSAMIISHVFIFDVKSASLITNILAPVWNLVLISSFWNYRMRDRY